MKSSSNKNKRHVLLISPLTFSYHIAISETLRSLGYEVTWWNDRASSSTLYKIALRIFPKLITRFTERVFLEKLYDLDALSVTHVLVIKGEGLSKHIADKLREHFRSASIGFYLWDSVDNARNAFSILPAFDSVSTFDPADAEKYGWVYRPLFWRNITQAGCAALNPEYDWSFIGTIHSDRHKVIHRLRNQVGQSWHIFVFGYFQSKLLLLTRMIFDRTLWVAPKETLSTRPMAASEVSQIVANSKAVLDVEHPRQKGFTMRTIETLLAGKKLITTNSSIVNSNLYDPSRVLVVNRETPKIPAEFLSTQFLPFDDRLRDYYSCKGWILELLSIQDASRDRLGRT